MTLFAPDLYRNFFIGFIGGGLILAAGLIDGVEGFGPDIVAKASAAETVSPDGSDIQVADEFLIPAEGAEALR